MSCGEDGRGMGVDGRGVGVPCLYTSAGTDKGKHVCVPIEFLCVCVCVCVWLDLLLISLFLPSYVV